MGRTRGGSSFRPIFDEKLNHSFNDFSQLLNLIISISLDVCNDALDGFPLE